MIRRFFLLIIFVTELFSNKLEIIEIAKQNKLYERIEWKSLLHFNNKLNIIDEKFITSSIDFSLKNELESTINGFFKEKTEYENLNEHFQCKFPARFLFIKKELELNDDLFPKIDCQEFRIYTNKAPADKISVVFASENVKNPSSMMGHTFFKFEGVNDKKEIKKHSLSFYTTIETFNIFTLLYENLVSGMKGIFVLRPYIETKNTYIEEEKRNIWEYELNLNEYQKKLISYHLWELKDIDIKYYFTKYNCSTIVFFALSTVNNNIYEDEKIWITPLDSVKYLYKYNLIKDTNLVASESWMNRMIKENFDKQNIDLQNVNFDISNYKSPNKIPDERQISLAYKNVNNNNFSKISFLPASHLLNGDNREYFGESELKIAYLSLLANNKSLKLDEFTLYGMKSYLPYQDNAKDLSSELSIGLKRDYNSKMSLTINSKISYGLGYDFNIFNDINLYFLINAGINYNKEDDLKLLISPKIGFTVYEIFDMKSVVDYEKLYFEKKIVYDKYSLSHNIFISKNRNIYFNLDKYKGKKSKTDFEIGFSLNF